jgi:hypothetical protein
LEVIAGGGVGVDVDTVDQRGEGFVGGVHGFGFSVGGVGGVPQVNRMKPQIAKMRHREPQRGVAIHAARPTVPPMARWCVTMDCHGAARLNGMDAPTSTGIKVPKRA